MKEKKLNGMIIERHRVIDAESKQQAQDSFWGWSYQQKTFSQWIHALESGQTITIANFETDKNDKYRHKKDLWIGTRHILTDADNIRGIEFNDKGEDVNPNGLEPFESETGLSELYPDLKTKARGVGQSISSMSEKHFIPHRRYRIAFEFDKLIRTPEQYKHVLSKLAQQFPIITPTKRHPAQPIFGNAREGFGKWAIMDNILSLDEYLSDFGRKQDTGKGSNKKGNGHGTHNATQRKYHNDIDRLIADAKLTRHETGDDGTVRVDCPFNADHKRDAFVKLDAQGFPTFKCHHNSCNGRGFNDMARLTGVEVVYQPHNKGQQRDIDFVGDPPEWTEDDIQREETTSQLKDFPEELFFGVFKTYREAHLDKVPMSDAFCFASLKHAISSLIGRKYFIKTTPTIFPNMFTALIGDSSDSAKGIAMSQSIEMLKATAPSVHRMNSLATAPGLMNMFTTPKLIEGRDDEDYYIGGIADKIKDTDFITDMIDNMCDRESIRNSLYLEEFSTLLSKAKTVNGAGLLQAIMELYDARNDSDVNTKVDALTIQYPTFSMIASSDKKLIEKVMGQEYISGGLTNRFEWYLGHDVESFFLNKEKDQKNWNECVLEIGKLRDKFDSTTKQVGFTMSNEANAVGEEFHQAYKAFLKETQEDEKLASDSLKRTKTHVLKNSLIFAILNNNPDNTEIGTTEVELAIRLSEWTTQATQHIFDNFALGENSKIRQRIISALTKHPRMSAKVLINKLKTEDTTKVFQLLDKMLQYKIIMREKPKRTELYSVIKQDAE